MSRILFFDLVKADDSVWNKCRLASIEWVIANVHDCDVIEMRSRTVSNDTDLTSVMLLLMEALKKVNIVAAHDIYSKITYLQLECSRNSDSRLVNFIKLVLEKRIDDVGLHHLFHDVHDIGVLYLKLYGIVYTKQCSKAFMCLLCYKKMRALKHRCFFHKTKCTQTADSSSSIGFDTKNHMKDVYVLPTSSIKKRKKVNISIQIPPYMNSKLNLDAPRHMVKSFMFK